MKYVGIYRALFAPMMKKSIRDRFGAPVLEAIDECIKKMRERFLWQKLKADNKEGFFYERKRTAF